MITTLEQGIKKKKLNSLGSDLNKYLFDNNQVTEYPRRIWFKGSRYR